MTKDEAYQNLSDLIYRGFLTTRIEMDGTYLVFKTINEREFNFIRLCSGKGENDVFKVRFNLNFLSYSLFMLNGDNVLRDRDERIGRIFQFFSNIPNHIVGRMISEINKLWTVSYDSIKYLEGFTYTQSSRRMWKVMGNVHPNDSRFTGVAGTEFLGLNVHQENWSYINRMLDREEDYEQQFTLAILQASATNPKGSKQIRAKHDSQAEALEGKRNKLATIGYQERSNWKPDGWAAPVDTAEDLVEELERQMSGVKDKHDIFMENYIKKIRENSDARAQEAQRKIEEYRKSLTEDDLPLTGSQRVLTPEEVKKRIKVGKSKRDHVAVLDDGERMTQEDKSRYINKVGNKVLTSRK